MESKEYTSAYGFRTTQERSYLMSRIKSNNTKPEITFRKHLWQRGIRYRINVKNLPGKPDIVIRKYKLAIFIDGEFWHGYNWQEKKKKIRTNRPYWIKKIEGNMERDQNNNKILEEDGWTVFRFWEKDIKNELEKCLEKVEKHIFL